MKGTNIAPNLLLCSLLEKINKAINYLAKEHKIKVEDRDLMSTIYDPNNFADLKQKRLVDLERYRLPNTENTLIKRINRKLFHK